MTLLLIANSEIHYLGQAKGCDFVMKQPATFGDMSPQPPVWAMESDEYHQLSLEGVSLSSPLNTEEAHPLSLSNWGCYLRDINTHPELHDYS